MPDAVAFSDELVDATSPRSACRHRLHTPRWPGISTSSALGLRLPPTGEEVNGRPPAPVGRRMGLDELRFSGAPYPRPPWSRWLLLSCQSQGRCRARPCYHVASRGREFSPRYPARRWFSFARGDSPPLAVSQFIHFTGVAAAVSPRDRALLRLGLVGFVLWRRMEVVSPAGETTFIHATNNPCKLYRQPPLTKAHGDQGWRSSDHRARAQVLSPLAGYEQGRRFLFSNGHRPAP